VQLLPAGDRKANSIFGGVGDFDLGWVGNLGGLLGVGLFTLT